MTNIKMKILILVPHLGLGGGAERIASSLGTSLHEIGYKVIFLTFIDVSQKYKCKGEHICLNENMYFDPITKLYKTLKRARKISEICKSRNIDIVISFLQAANFAAIVSKTHFRNESKIIVSERNNTLKKSKFFQILTKLFYRKADLVVTLSRGVEKALNNHINIKKTKTVYNMQTVQNFCELGKKPLNNKKHAKIYTNSFVFITIGRLQKQKAQWNLIRSFKKVSDVKKNAKLIILGDGNLKSNLNELIQVLDLQKKVYLLGTVDNVFPYLSRSDCFVLSSDYEGFGNVITEALSQNTPVISTDCEYGPREILCPEINIDEEIEYPFQGKYGILVEPFHGIKRFLTLKEEPLSKKEKSLATIMIEMIENNNLREKYAKGRKRAMYFDKKNIIKEWEKIIN